MRENLEDHRGHTKHIPIIYQEYFLFLNYQVQQCDESIRGRNGSQKDPPGAQHQLVSYVEKVRKLQMATDVIDAMPKQKGIE